jgi:acyl-CoA thioesterase-1
MGALVALGSVVSAPLSIASEPDPVPTGRVLVLGDSLTKGYGLLEEEAYPALLEARLEAAGGRGWDVVNAGVSGDTSAGGLRRAAWLLKRPPDLLVLALGANDGLRGIDPASTEKNLQAIIDLARAAAPDVRVVIAGMTVPANLGPDFVSAFEAVFPRLAEANRAILIPFLLDGVAGDDALNQDDRIHPNAEGQKVIAETVWKALAPLVGEERSEG